MRRCGSACARSPWPRLAGAAVSLAAQAPPAATLVLVNGRIHTVDAANTTVEAVAIAGDRIVATGTTARDARAGRPGRAARSISAGGRSFPA